MYFVENIKRFLRQKDLHGQNSIGPEEAQAILERAESFARKNKKGDVLLAGQSEEIFQNEMLTKRFNDALGSNKTQIMITMELLHKRSGQAM